MYNRIGIGPNDQPMPNWDGIRLDVWPDYSVGPQKNAIGPGNIIAFNTSLLYGAGGLGIYYSYPSLGYNAFFENVPNHIDGDFIDSDIIGVYGNALLDPVFRSRIPGNRDLRLDSSSSAPCFPSTAAVPHSRSRSTSSILYSSSPASTK